MRNFTIYSSLENVALLLFFLLTTRSFGNGVVTPRGILVAHGTTTFLGSFSRQLRHASFSV